MLLQVSYPEYLIGLHAVILLRIVAPLVILKHPLAGGLISIILDYFDWEIITQLNTPNIFDYQATDKLLDLFYLTLEYIVVLSWKQYFIKQFAQGLFYYRLIGILLFEITQFRYILFLFPNLFENFFLLYIIFSKLTTAEHKFDVKTNSALIISLLIVFFYKIYQEYSLHIAAVNPWLGADLFTGLLSSIYIFH